MPRPPKGVAGRTARREILEDVEQAHGGRDPAPLAAVFDAGERVVAQHLAHVAARTKALDRELASKRPDTETIRTLADRLDVARRSSAPLATLLGSLATVAKVRSQIRVDQAPDRIVFVGASRLREIAEGDDGPEGGKGSAVH